ncbi:MAG: hypothetical protein IPG96_16020 [Proteobacteria bacterium]|nr:hypothetical protein [Pseudomonadota bacterium]
MALACGAAGGRLALRVTTRLEGALPPTIDLPRVAIASGSVAWGLMALLWGTHGLAQQLEAPAAPGGRRWPASIAAGLAVVLALHSAAPFWRLLGLEINHWTVGGLFGLAATAYAIELGYRRLRRR